VIPPADMEVEKFHGALVQRLARFVEVFASLAVRSPSLFEVSVYRFNHERGLHTLLLS
jgi:hypothetical protein